jgi:hypothetical protein
LGINQVLSRSMVCRRGRDQLRGRPRPERTGCAVGAEVCCSNRCSTPVPFTASRVFPSCFLSFGFSVSLIHCPRNVICLASFSHLSQCVDSSCSWEELGARLRIGFDSRRNLVRVGFKRSEYNSRKSREFAGSGAASTPGKAHHTMYLAANFQALSDSLALWRAAFARRERTTTGATGRRNQIDSIPLCI